MIDLAYITVIQAADMIAARTVKSVDLLHALWARMDALNPSVNAVIWEEREVAEEAARLADAVVTEGKQKLRPLHGVPMAHKDMYYQAGKLSTGGSALRRDYRPKVTATVIERLRAAGSYTFAGLNMAEFAQNPTGHNKTFGDCHNPWNLPYITGGSSSGSGASIAARFNYASLGSDTGGSVRLPASACGVTGLKPTQTRVSRYGVMPLSFSLDNVGPLARTARDCARILSVVAGHDPLDPTSAREAVMPYEKAMNGELNGVRVGVPVNYFLDGADTPVVEAMEAALEVLKGRGATVSRVEVPLMDAISAYQGVVFRSEAAAIHSEWMRKDPQAYGAHISARMYPGWALPASYYVEALSRRGPILKAFAGQVFADVDVLVTPTIRTCLPTLAETDIDNGPPEAVARFMAVSANTRPFNYLGLPAISVPCGLDPNGCPIGLQIAGRPFGEARILQVAGAYQLDTDWHWRRPPMVQAAA